MGPEKRNRKAYTKEFKSEAVRLVTEEKHGIGETARRLGINVRHLGRWKRELPGKRAEGSLMDGEREELKRLRTENRHLEMERNILKKATAFFAKDTR